MNVPPSLAACSTALALVFVASQVGAQPKGKVGQYSDVTIEGSVLEPTKGRGSKLLDAVHTALNSRKKKPPTVTAN